MMLVDSHCHLDRLDLTACSPQHLDTVIDQAHAAGVGAMLCVGISEANAGTVKQLAETYPCVYASVGVHPLDISETVITHQALAALANHPKVVAIGETGLDNHYGEAAADQTASFVVHLEVAKQLQLPVIVHTREAKNVTIQLIREHACDQYAGVLHCFTEDWAMAKAALDCGFYISLSGIVTFKNATSLKDIAKTIPADRLLVETDAPYLTPVPFRSKPNYPAHTREVAQYVADLRGDSLVELAQYTTANFYRLFSKAA